MFNLSREAETFLARLDKALYPLCPDDRETIMLELRSHLEERQAQGRLHLLSALEHMGSPEQVAKSFIEAARPWEARETAAKSVLLPAIVTNSNLPSDYMRGVPRLRLNELARDFRATLKATRDTLWAASVVMVCGFTAMNFLASVNAVSGSEAFSSDLLLTMARFAFSVLTIAAVYRSMLTEDDPWQLNRATVEFFSASALLLGIFAISAILLRGATAEWAMSASTKWGIFILCGATFACAYLRLQPWLIGLIVGDRRVTLRASWKETKEKLPNLILAWGIFVAPLFFLHVLLSLLADDLSLRSLMRFGLAFSIGDAIITMLMVIAMTTLNAISYRWIVNEAIPEPRPFSTTEPTPDQLARTGMIFAQKMEEARARRRTGAPR